MFKRTPHFNYSLDAASAVAACAAAAAGAGSQNIG
jgi:hypothetical protein